MGWPGPHADGDAGSGTVEPRYAAAGSLPRGGGPLSRSILQNAPVWTSNVLADPETWLEPGRAQIEREGFKAVAAAPLASKGRVHGALVVHYSAEQAVYVPVASFRFRIADA